MDAIAAYGGSDSEEEENASKGRGKCSSESTSNQVRAQPSAKDREPRELGRKPPRGGITFRGYVPKRKRTSSIPFISEVQPEALQSVSQYICLSSQSSESPSAIKRIREGNRIPKACVTRFAEHSKPILRVEWHPYDVHLLLSASLDGTVKLWDAIGQEKCINTYRSFHSEAIEDAKWVTKNTVITGAFDMFARHSDIEKGEVLVSFKHEGFVTVVNVHPKDRNLIFTGDSNGNIQSWDLRTGKKVAKYVGAGGRILDIAFLQNSSEFVASSDIVRKNAVGQALAVWDIESTVVLSNQVYLEPFTCPCLKIHPNESNFMAQSNANYVVVFSSNKPYKLNKYKRFQGHTVEGYAVQFGVSPDGTIIASASANGQVYFYDYHSDGLIKAISLATFPCLSVSWHPVLPSTIAVSDWNAQIHILQ